MSLTKRAISFGVSAALLASLVATAVAPGALAAVTVGSVGVVPVGGTSTNVTSTVLFTFTEPTDTSWGTTLTESEGGSFQVVIGDSAWDGTTFPVPAADATVSFVGTASTAGSTGSLGATATASGNVLTVNIAGSDPNNEEAIYISGLQISATTAAHTGAIVAALVPTNADLPTLTGFTGVFISGAGTLTTGGTATGTIATGIGAGATSLIVNVTSGTCYFTPTTTSGNPLSFATSPETENIATASGIGTPATGQQTLTLTTGTASVHNSGEVVSETTGCAAGNAISSPGTVGAALLFATPTVLQVFAGEDNQAGGELSATETSYGFLSSSVPSTVTLTVTTPGVVFSEVPAWTGSNGVVLATPVLSATRNSVTWTVTGASTVTPGTITFSPYYDVASTVTNGTQISVTLSTTAGPVSPVSEIDAQVGRIFTASAASVPNVFIGQNGQTAGMITIVEVAAGSFTAGVGPTNTIELCLNESDENLYTGTPVYAEVVGGVAAGNLILRDGALASTTNIVAGTWDGNSCVYWNVWTASTVASTILIGSTNPVTAGPLLNIEPNAVPGPVNAKLYASATASPDPSYTPNVTVQIANRVFQNSVDVTALSQPYIAPGSGDALVGSLQIQETGIGQLQPYEHICVVVLPRTSNGLRTQDTLINWQTTANVPVATATNGVTIDSVNLDTSCASEEGPSLSGFSITSLPYGYTNAFSFNITQQSMTGNGTVTINNIHYSVTPDAVLGPVQVEVFGLGAGVTEQEFAATLSNAIVGSVGKVVLSADSSLIASGPFSTATKILKPGESITIRVRTNPSLPGTRLGVWIAKKTGTTWSAYKPHISVTTDATGTAYYTYKFTSKVWLGFRFAYVGTSALMPAMSPGIFGRAV
ncbi:MAG: hypothetical protein ACLQBX_17995 [Candidatus Limnocylindrales bacterium]